MPGMAIYCGHEVRDSDFRGQPFVMDFFLPTGARPVCGNQVALYNELMPEFNVYTA